MSLLIEAFFIYTRYKLASVRKINGFLSTKFDIYIYLYINKQKQNAMKTLTINNRTYRIIETTSIENYPNLKKQNANIKDVFVAEGKKGALISGYLFNDGTFNIF